MANNYIKKYECGNLGLDLPFANCIYELPLLSFSDMRSSLTLSLVFNREMKENGDNTYKITSGYKLNLQKRIYFDGGVGYYQESNGKIVQLFNNVKSEGTYTFPDDSQRIIRAQGENEYILEYPDYSIEKFDLNGKITELVDKYNDKLLTYEYSGDTLTSITYKGQQRSLATPPQLCLAVKRE